MCFDVAISHERLGLRRLKVSCRVVPGRTTATSRSRLSLSPSCFLRTLFQRASKTSGRRPHTLHLCCLRTGSGFRVFDVAPLLSMVFLLFVCVFFNSPLLEWIHQTTWLSIFWHDLTMICLAWLYTVATGREVGEYSSLQSKMLFVVNQKLD